MLSRGLVPRGQAQWPPVEGDILTRLVTRGYREVARRTAAMLASSPVVRSVLLHRSVAAGEVTFGYSDIDLLVNLRQPCTERMDGPELFDLYERVRRVKRVNPRLGHVEIHDPEGFQSWFHVDTYRGSKERRSATLLCGEPVTMPEVPVRCEDALRRFALWPFYFLSSAIARRDRRDLRKIALEMWSAYATVTGLVSEPFLTRRATEAFCRSRSGGSIPGDLDLTRARDALTFLFRTAEDLHRRVLPPLSPIRGPIFEGAPYRPASKMRPFVVLPAADSLLPEQNLDPATSFYTLELLDICVQFALPHLYWTLTPPLLELGIRQPTAAAFFQYARYFSHSVMLRIPGFLSEQTTTPFVLNARNRHIARHLAQGRIPPRPDGGHAAPDPPPSIAAYYQRFYPRLLSEYRDTAALLGTLEESIAGPCSRL